MKKFINKPDRFVDEMLEGILAAHPNQLAFAAGNRRNIVRARVKDKVGLVSGGGSGHLPLFMGYVGEGLLDGCAVGGVFQSPSAEQMFEVTKAVSRGKGVLYIFGNYSGDKINFNMSQEMAELEDIKIGQVIGMDDVASAPKGEEHKRRGVAGMFFVYKVAGAAAEAGKDFDEVKRLAEKACSRVRTMGVALSPCIIPEVGKPSFSLGDDEMEIGMGIHGEHGVRRGKLRPADEVVDEMMGAIFADMEYAKGDSAAVLVNGLGATPKEELYIINRKVDQILTSKGIRVYHTYVGEFATSMEMAGFSISLIKLDDELKGCLAKPACTPFFEQMQY